jgi:hypothetical protein
MYQRQRLVLHKAEQTNAIVSSLFPKQVRDRMMEEANFATDKNNKSLLSRKAANAIQTRNGQSADGEQQLSRPIADLFPEATVLFSDIAGFTVSYVWFWTTFLNRRFSISYIRFTNIVVFVKKAWSSSRGKHRSGRSFDLSCVACCPYSADDC